MTAAAPIAIPAIVPPLMLEDFDSLTLLSERLVLVDEAPEYVDDAVFEAEAPVEGVELTLVGAVLWEGDVVVAAADVDVVLQVTAAV